MLWAEYRPTSTVQGPLEASLAYKGMAWRSQYAQFKTLVVFMERRRDDELTGEALMDKRKDKVKRDELPDPAADA